MRPAGTPQENQTSTQEFRSRYFGRRPIGLSILQSVAVWVSVALIFTMALTPVLAHGKPLETQTLIALSVTAFIGVGLQWLVWQFSKTVDRRKVVWSPTDEHIEVFQHRVSSGFLSFGRIEPTFIVPLAGINSARVVKGRGRHLRLHTSNGFVSISNDIERFDELCTIILSRQ